MTRLGTRSVAVLGWVAVGLVVVGIGLGQYYQSPDEAALRQTPPYVAVTDPVQRAILEDGITFRGRLVPAAAAALEFAAVLNGLVVTRVGIREGQELELGAAVIEVEGRPVIVLPGALPTWRDFSAGMSGGPDVRQLQAALRELGIYEGPITGRFGRATQAAVNRLYARAGYRAPAGPRVPEREMVFVPPAFRTVSAVHVEPGDRMSDAAVEVATSEVRIDATLSADAQSAIAAGQHVELVPPFGGTGGKTRVTEVVELAPGQGTGEANTGIVLAEPIAGRASGEQTFKLTVARTPEPVLSAAAAAVQVSSTGEPYVVLLEGTDQRTVPVSVGLVTAGRVEVRPIPPSALREADLLVLNPIR